MQKIKNVTVTGDESIHFILEPATDISFQDICAVPAFWGKQRRETQSGHLVLGSTLSRPH